MYRASRNPGRLEFLLLAGTLLVLAWSGHAPADRTTWVLEVLPVLVGLPLLVLSYRRFTFTALAYVCMSLHAVVLMVGGHYTYSEMPLFDWLQEALQLTRNHYDRIGHVAQGFFPAIVAREILMRATPLRPPRRPPTPLRPGAWLAFLVLSICLAISALYELLEWWVALAADDGAVAFLATQGDVWDTQWDMFLALIGAVAALLLLSGLHNRQLRRRTWMNG